MTPALKKTPHFDDQVDEASTVLLKSLLARTETLTAQTTALQNRQTAFESAYQRDIASHRFSTTHDSPRITDHLDTPSSSSIITEVPDQAPLHHTTQPNLYSLSITGECHA